MYRSTVQFQPGSRLQWQRHAYARAPVPVMPGAQRRPLNSNPARQPPAGRPIRSRFQFGDELRKRGVFSGSRSEMFFRAAYKAAACQSIITAAPQYRLEWTAADWPHSQPAHSAESDQKPGWDAHGSYHRGDGQVFQAPARGPHRAFEQTQAAGFRPESPPVRPQSDGFPVPRPKGTPLFQCHPYILFPGNEGGRASFWARGVRTG